MTTPLTILLAVLAFLGTLALIVAVAALSLWWFRGGTTGRARYAAMGAVGAGVAYLVILGAASLASREVVLPVGGEKYFCELDCHLAYEVLSAGPVARGPDTGDLWEVVVQTRFDETTISPRRPRDATLTPAPRRIRLRFSGDALPPLSPAELSVAGIVDQSVPMDRPLIPGESYRTSFWFRVPPQGRPEVLLLEDDMTVSRLLIGHERSPFHAKVLLALPTTLAVP